MHKNIVDDAGPVLANPLFRDHCKGLSVVSVTSDVAASVSVQSAPSKPATRSQTPQADDQFGTLVDSNPTAASSTRTSDPAPRRSDSATSSSDKSTRDTSATDPSSQNK